jgi:hypothetical protein
MPEKPPMLDPKNVSNRSNGFVCTDKKNRERTKKAYLREQLITLRIVTIEHMHITMLRKVVLPLFLKYFKNRGGMLLILSKQE